MLDPGDKAPDFTLPDQGGKPFKLSAALDDGPLLLYFYPADFTPGCTAEACRVRDMHDDIVSAGLRVVGISPQDAASHTRFAEKHGLDFPLLADTDKAVVRKYGVDGPLGIGVRRASFLIGPDGTIEDTLLADLRVDRHEKFFRRAIVARRQR